MTLELKRISRASIPAAIAKSDRYRLLNEPGEAESICRDILAIDPENQEALTRLGLAITDQFVGEESDRLSEAEEIFRRLDDPYQRLYYAGLLRERRAKAQIRSGHPPHTVPFLLEEAMRLFEQAERIRPPNEDGAILRWNRCLRLIQSREWGLQRERLPEGD